MSTIGHRVRFALDHRWAPSQMSAYLDGELPSRERARLDRHVKECGECRGVQHSLRRMLGVLQGLPRASGADAQAIVTAVRLRLHEPPNR